MRDGDPSYWFSEKLDPKRYSLKGHDTFDPKNDYIGIRLEQGVPLLDRDWNELEDIRRYQEMILRRWYIGDGTPDNGFCITIDNADPQKIKISLGRYLVDGFEAVNDPRNPAKCPTLHPHEEGKYDLVYLDLWITEVDGPIDDDVKMKTCARHKIEWEVKIIENISIDEQMDYLAKALNEIKKIKYHYYSPLALLVHDQGANHETAVIDLRCIINHAPLTHSISANKFKDSGENVFTVDPNGAIENITIKKSNSVTINISNDMALNYPYRYAYALLAEVPGGTTSDPLTSTIRFKRNFYRKGIGVEPVGDSKNIVIKSDDKDTPLDYYTSDLRPFWLRNKEIIINNIGENEIKIHSFGFIYFLSR